MQIKNVNLRGLRSAQPDAGEVNEGFLYFVTDESLIERSSGSVWESYSPSGGGGGGWVLVETGTYTGSKTISGLEGDTDKVYKLITRQNRASGFESRMQFNSDSGSHYNLERTYNLYAGGDNYNGRGRQNNETYFAFAFGDIANQFVEVLISAVSGYNRNIRGSIGGAVDNNNFGGATFSGFWSNTTDELTSITILPSLTLTAGEYWLYKAV